MESDRWYFFLSADRQRLSAMADGLPPQTFKAIRFMVGLPSDVDHSDPSVWPAGHPLHPDVCGLHWGWQGGYVFLAIEGHFKAGSGQPDGFSYHLARADHPMMVELPVSFSGSRSHTLRLGMDLAKLTSNGAVIGDGLSTHSREGDALAILLKERVPQTFRFIALRPDLLQDPISTGGAKPLPLPPGTHRYHLEVSQRLPKVQLPSDNPLTVEGVLLGRRLFEEKRLSRTGTQSCASCHEREKAFSDGRTRSPGAEGQEGRRNAMALVNLAWGNRFFWDGRAGSLREQVLMPIQDAREMHETLPRVVEKLSSDQEYRDLFHRAFGDANITSSRIALALEQFLLTQVSQESRFDRAARKLDTLTDEERLGLKLFVTEYDPTHGLRGADCFHCHGGNLFSSQQFANNGLEMRDGDRGRMEVTGQESDRGKFKVPSLRNIAATGPYMHDGRFATLEEVVDHYDHGVRRSPTLDPNLSKHPDSGLGLTALEKRALVAFLRTLTDSEFLQPNSGAVVAPDNTRSSP